MCGLDGREAVELVVPRLALHHLHIVRKGLLSLNQYIYAFHNG